MFVCLLSFFSSFLPPSRQTNDKFGNFFSNFQGFTLVPWQKVGRIWLGSAQNEPIIYQILFFPLPVFERYDTKAKISYFSSSIWCVITIIFHSGSSKRNFWCKELISSWRIGKVSNLSPISAIFSRQTNDIYVNFFSNFQGFTLSSWQKVGRLWLGFAQNPTSLSNPSLP